MIAGPSGIQFVYRSVVPAPAADVFAWHERPDALQALLPPGGLVRIERIEGGIRDGGWARLSVGVGPFRTTWKARHFGFVAGRQFCDEMVRGPFAAWRHVHRVEPLSADQTLYEDAIELTLPGGPLVNRLAARPVRTLLAAAFARRHQVVRAHTAAHREKS